MTLEIDPDQTGRLSVDNEIRLEDDIEIVDSVPVAVNVSNPDPTPRERFEPPKQTDELRSYPSSSGLSWMAGRPLRALAGVEEPIFRVCGGERARFSSLGGVLVGTASIAGFSMGMAWIEVFGGYRSAVLPIAIGWALFVLSLDRWIVASISSGRFHQRLGGYLARLSIAIFLGIVIAEPLVLRIFETAIEKQVFLDRQKIVGELRTNLLRCNPERGEALSPDQPGNLNSADCQEYLLTVSSVTSPSELVAQRDSLSAQASTLRSQVDAASSRVKELTDLVIKECSGVSSDLTTGVPGDGPVCRQNREALTTARSDIKLDEMTGRLSNLDKSIEELTGQISRSAMTYNSTLKELINDRVAETTDALDNSETPRPLDAPIGFLERFRTLNHLAQGDWGLTVAVWSIRAVFVLIDSAPVVIKMLSTSSNYERVVEQRLASVRERERLRNEDETDALIHSLRNDRDRRRREADRWAEEALSEAEELSLSMKAARQQAIIAERERILSSQDPIEV